MSYDEHAPLITPHELQPPMDERVVNFHDPKDVAVCLINNGDYDGHALISSFSEQDIQDFAVEDANRIIDQRTKLLLERNTMRPKSVESRMAQLILMTTYVPSVSRLKDEAQRTVG